MSNRVSRRLPSTRQTRQPAAIKDEDVFSYALRAAYLHYLLLPRARLRAPAPTPQQAPHRSGTVISINELIREFSGHKDSKSPKLPKDLLPMLRQKLEQVWMGHYSQAEYKDPMVKRTFATFYTAFTEESFYTQVKKSRKPEDLILIFYSSATKELQKAKQDDSWKWLVDRHLALFIRLILICIREAAWTSHQDLVHRLGSLETRLLRNEQNLADDSAPSPAASTPTVLQPMAPLSYNVNDMPLVRIVSKVFGVTLPQCQQIIDQNKSIWTERAALQDLKTYTSNLNFNTKKTLRSDDFDTDEAFEAWRKSETPTLSQMMLTIVQSNPLELAKTTSSPVGPRSSMALPPMYPSDLRSSSIPDVSSMYTVDQPADMESYSTSNSSSVDDMDSPYTYIPNEPRLYYRAVLDKCVLFDLKDTDPATPEASSDGPVKIMSKASTDLLLEISARWRIPIFSQMALLLDVIREKYHDQEINLVTLDAAFVHFKDNTEPDWTRWTVADQMCHRQMLSSLHEDLLRELYEILQHAYEPKAISIGPAMYILDAHVYSDPLFSQPDMDPIHDQLKEGLKERALEAYDRILSDIPTDPSQMDALHIHDTVENIIKLTKKIQKRFEDPIFGKVNPTFILVEVVYPKFSIDSRNMLENVIEAFRSKGDEVPVEDGFVLYEKLVEIRRIYHDVCPKQLFPVKFEELLEGFVWQWLKISDSKVIGWVDEAIKHDNFLLTIREEQGREPTDDERHTSSVVDIFRSFNQMVSELKKLEWQDEYQNAKFFTALSKTLSSGLSRYCEVLEKLFTFEMDRLSPEQEAASNQTRQERWLAIAKEAWSNKERIEPFQFAPESCVKLNNIEFAIQQLDKLEHNIDVDGCAATIARFDPPIQQTGKTNYVFTVKIVEAEDLKAMDINGSSDPYVVLGDEYQKRLHKTRVIYTNLNPRWEESVDITTQGAIWLTATLWDWDTVGDHDCLGRTSIKLDPAHFGDFVPKEYWLDLDTQGRLLLRVSMEGERDDIAFHFGRCFRTLKRTERDMIRQITDKLSAYIHHCLSRSTLKGLLSKGYSISAVSSLLSRTGLTGARPQSIASSVSEHDIQQSLVPLTDYFNENFAILNQALTQASMIMVMSKLWKEALLTIETLLVPTLSDKPSNQKPLTQQEVDVVFKWLNIMFEFFYAKDEVTGEGTGVPLEVLKSPKFHELQSLNFFYFDSTDNLVRTSERMANAQASRLQQERQRMMVTGPTNFGGAGGLLGIPGGAKRTKSILHSRNLGTMRKVKAEKRREAQAEPSDDMILRILRMRPEAAGYLRDRSRQKERLAAAAAAEMIVKQSISAGGGRMSAMGTNFGMRR